MHGNTTGEPLRLNHKLLTQSIFPNIASIQSCLFQKRERMNKIPLTTLIISKHHLIIKLFVLV